MPAIASVKEAKAVASQLSEIEAYRETVSDDVLYAIEGSEELAQIGEDWCEDFDYGWIQE
jgi:hypothetical protein